MVAALPLGGGREGSLFAQDATAVRPFFDLRVLEPEYVGPSGDVGNPDELREIPIGYFGPADPGDPVYGSLWSAAQRAVDDANAQGGLEGKPFGLRSAWSDNPWGNGITQVTQLVYRDRVWAIVGGVDGPTTHLAEQVVVKARVALVSPVSTDKTVNLTNVPWMFSLSPNDQRVAAAMVDEIVRRTAAKTLLLLSTTDHDARLLVQELRRALVARQVQPQFQFEYEPQSRKTADLYRECLARRPDVILLVAGPTDSAELVLGLRAAGFGGCIVGGPACGRDHFVQMAGSHAGELIFPSLVEMTGNPSPTAASSTIADVQHPGAGATVGDYAAQHVYDAVTLVTHAIRKAGLNRPAIGRALRELSPTSGLSGRIEWDPPGGNLRQPHLATFEDGRMVPFK